MIPSGGKLQASVTPEEFERQWKQQIESFIDGLRKLRTPDKKKIVFHTDMCESGYKKQESEEK